jgi:hypothetical protein
MCAPRLAPTIRSGGQTGVDRAALDTALELGLECKGWCPRGRRAEDGVIDTRYPLRETPDADYAQRTAWNVRDADATLILARGRLRGGTSLTRRFAAEAGKPHRTVELPGDAEVGAVRGWLLEKGVRVLNVAGPRESQEPGIYAEARGFLARLLGDAEETE